MAPLATPAAPSQLGALRNLMQLYAHDFSELIALDVGPDGRFALPPLEPYWEDPWRFPYVLHTNDKLVGFALVHRKSKLTGALDVWDMAEFFVLRRHRRAGVGSRAAQELFAAHPGKWEVRQRVENVAATAFWRRAIAQSVGDAFTETLYDDARWRGRVQSFTR